MKSKFKVGDWVRTSSLPEPMKIESFFNAEDGCGHYYEIEHWANLVNADGTIHTSAKIHKLRPIEMSKEEAINNFNITCITDLKKTIKNYENLTGDKVLNVSYDAKSETIAIVTKNFGLVKNIT